MPTMSIAAGTPVAGSLSNGEPLPRVAVGEPPALASLLALMRPQPAAADAVSPPPPREEEDRGEDSTQYPEHLLALLLAAATPQNERLPQTGGAWANGGERLATAGEVVTRPSSDNVLSGVPSVSPLPPLLRNAAGNMVAEVACRDGDGQHAGFAAAQRIDDVGLDNAPTKPLHAAAGDMRLAQLMRLSALPKDREAQTADPTLLHPAAARVNALITGEVVNGRLPAVRLPAAPERQAEMLKKALGERLDMQIEGRVQKATIRLDPPHLGKMEIVIHVEVGKLQVQIQATQPEVTRLLQQVSQELRASLSEQNGVQANVQVFTHSDAGRQQQQQHRQPARSETVLANDHDEVSAQQRATDGTILTMV